MQEEHYEDKKKSEGVSQANTPNLSDGVDTDPRI
jgi:hypothetical protein